MDVLIVEDDRSIAESLIAALRESGLRPRHVATGAAAIAAVSGASGDPDIVLLDLGLPDVDGYDVCRAMRAVSAVPIIVVTARSDEFDRVLGLELGADDYMVKPLGTRELVARIRAVLRRSKSGATGTTPDGGDADSLSAGALRIDLRTHRAFLHEEELALTPKEFDLLAFLSEDPGAVRTRTDIIEHVWDSNWFGPTKTVDAHVASLRKKLGDQRWIVAVRGVGFRLEIPSGGVV